MVISSQIYVSICESASCEYSRLSNISDSNKKTEDRKRKREQKNNGASSLLFRMYAKPIELKKNYFGLKL